MTARYRFGIEEEFFLADSITRGTPRGNLKAFHAAAKARLPEAERELLQLQVETASSPTDSFMEARAALAAMRARRRPRGSLASRRRTPAASRTAVA